MKMSVIYYSKTGNTKQMAEAIAIGMTAAGDTEAKAMHIEDIDGQWLKESRCAVIGTPVYMASVCGQIKSWLEGPCMQYGLSGKLGGAFATADYVHGGGELAIQLILDHMLVLGMLAYSGGGAKGKPVIHLGPVAIKEKLNEYNDTFLLYGKRMAEKALELFSPK